MTDRPIIFSAPMVRALLDGRKTQTRRVLCQFDPDRDPPHAGPYIAGHRAATWTDREGTPWRYPGAKGSATGDRLWVREAFIGPYAYEVNEYPPRDWGNKAIWFPADGPVPEKHAGQFWHRARPSIHMPRWASRLTLTVTDVRVQRLQDISAKDSIAEGAHCRTCEAMGQSACHGRGCFASIDAYRTLWNSLHGPGAWDANPWVVALTFTVQRGNIDKIGDANG
jgi:hypothetical protein